MKRCLLVFTFFFLLFTCLSAQKTKLPESKRYSEKAYIYKIAPNNLHSMYVDDYQFSDNMLGELVAEYLNYNKSPRLTRGNYMIVSAVDNKLNVTDYTEDNFYYKVIPSKELMLFLYDSLGNVIKDAVVKCKSKTLQFDAERNVYVMKKMKGEKVLEINNRGVFHYIDVEKPSNERSRHYAKSLPNFFKSVKRKARNFWWRTKYKVKSLLKKDDDEKYDGFIVFSKPKYKPGEVVKLKAYLTKKDGTPYKKAVYLVLSGGRKDTTLINLSPYRDGMYEYQFKLSDSLQLDLDRDYSIRLEPKKYDYAISGRFKYEDYELKDIRFKMDLDKETSYKNDTVKLKFKATDENDMARFGGKVDVSITPIYGSVQTGNNEKTFVADTLWTYTLPFGEASEKELVIPDSIFPKNVSIECLVRATYTSDDNQKRSDVEHLYRNTNDYNIDMTVKNGNIKIDELFQGKSISTSAIVTLEGENSETLKSMEVLLPYETILPWYVTHVEVKTKSNHFYNKPVNNITSGEQVDCRFYADGDSLFFQVKNPSHVPVWYTIMKNNHVFEQGYFEKDFSYKKKVGKKDAFNLKLNYLYASDKNSVDKEIPLIEKNLVMQVSTPTAVYPGQKTNVNFVVKDKNGKPAKNVDITAYAITNKFDENDLPQLPVYGFVKKALRYKETNYDVDEEGFHNKQTALDWDKWKSPMSLDTIAYYQFLYPKPFYSYTEPTNDNTTQVSPYVVMDGAIQPIYAMWIDNRTYYIAQAQQLDSYVFRVSSGKHDFRFRLQNRIVTVNNVYLQAGMKNIVSFDASVPSIKKEYPDHKFSPYVMTSKIVDKKLGGNLSKNETEQLAADMITVENNFGYISFPNIFYTVQIPGFIKSGKQIFYLNNQPRNSYNRTLRGYANQAILAGPFPEREFVNGENNVASAYGDGKFLTYFAIEGGNQYTFFNRYQKIKGWKTNLINNDFTSIPDNSFKSKPITLDDIQQNFYDQIHSALISTSGTTQRVNSYIFSNRLELKIGNDKFNKPVQPSLIYITSEDNSTKYHELYYGGTRSFSRLPKGNIKVSLIFRDSTVVTKSMITKSGGVNYLKFDSINYVKDYAVSDSAFNRLNYVMQKMVTQNPFVYQSVSKEQFSSAPVISFSDKSLNGLVAGTVLDENKEPIIGASVKIRNSSIATTTDFNGHFTIQSPNVCELEIAYIGYKPQIINVLSGNRYSIVLDEDNNALDEVIVVGYGAAERKGFTGAISNISALEGRVAGVQVSEVGASNFFSIRGVSSLDANAQPLYIVDGLPYTGKYEDIDPQSIASINVLKDASAVALYGTKAANGVIIVQTKGFKSKVEKALSENEGTDLPGNTIRRNFHDDAFWHPRITTDSKGKASFEVTYPDDITTWNANFIAIGGKRKTDKQQLSIRSFKALTARLSVPRFTVRGDEFKAIGRISNYLGDTISVSRSYKSNNQIVTNNLKVKTNYLDSIAAKAADGDSLTLSYSIQSANGFVDGEERSLPILEKGMLQTYGNFQVLNDSLTHKLKTDAALGDVTIHAESSSFGLFLDEIDKVEKYQYMCNEQMASKIRALLSKKRLYKMLGIEFKNEPMIRLLIQKLTKNRNSLGLWGWWNVNESVFWVSKQVVTAMLEAEEAGYTTNLNKNNLIDYYKQELDGGLASLKTARPENIPYAKQELFERLMLLKRLNATMDYEGYFKQINLLKNRSLNDKMKTFQVMATIGLGNQIPMDSLMKYSRQTILGSLYWSNWKENNFYFSLPYENNTEYTLMAYSIFKNMGNKEKELEQIRNYFFEMRNGGKWANTYESTSIMSAILPDMIKENESLKDASLTIDGKKIIKFPYTEKLKTSAKEIEIRKSGTAPVFITAYQQAWNPQPLAEAKKGFVVKSYFAENKDTVSVLQGGKTVNLEVSVTLKADAQYVQIEIPIPAGCSYESKPNSYWSGNHCEYFKDKVVIFYNRLNKGSHLFKIELNPRFSGKYTLNPAKAELMYFPTFYGNENVKQVQIK